MFNHVLGVEMLLERSEEVGEGIGAQLKRLML